MELLLFLSAILSALTGAISGVRAPETQIHQACVAGNRTSAAALADVTPVQQIRSYLVLASGWTPRNRQAYPSIRIFPAGIVTMPLYMDKLRN